MWTCLRCGYETADAVNQFYGRCGAPRNDQNITGYDVYLMGSDPARKIKVIKTVREISTPIVLGLKEALDVVEHPPQPVAMNLSREEADTLQAKLRAAGAEVEICPLGTPPSKPVAPLPASGKPALSGCTIISLVIGIAILFVSLLMGWLAHLQ